MPSSCGARPRTERCSSRLRGGWTPQERDAHLSHISETPAVSYDETSILIAPLRRLDRTRLRGRPGGSRVHRLRPSLGGRRRAARRQLGRGRLTLAGFREELLAQWEPPPRLPPCNGGTRRAVRWPDHRRFDEPCALLRTSLRVRHLEQLLGLADRSSDRRRHGRVRIQARARTHGGGFILRCPAKRCSPMRPWSEWLTRCWPHQASGGGRG
jgi:hypothetical protein